MIASLLEFLLLGAWNRSQQKRHDRSLAPPAPVMAPAPMQPPEDAVVLGRTLPLVPGQSESLLWLETAERCKHLAITGATGSGKTTALRHLLRADFGAHRATFLADFNGDLMDGALALLAGAATPEDLSGRLLLLDLRDPSHLPAFNVLQSSGEGDDAYTRALSLLDAVRRSSDSWGVQLQETLLACFIALSESGFTLLEVEPLLSNAAFRAYVVARTRSDYARGFFARYEVLSGDKQAAWRGPVLNKLSFLAHPDVRLLLGQKNGFSFRRFDDVPGHIVLMAFDRPRLQGAADTVAALLGASLLQSVLGRARLPEAARSFLHIALDEAQHFAGEDLNVLLAEGRRYGAALSLAHQNLSQMPSSTSAIIRNNCGTRLFFATGAPDAAEIAREIVLDVPADAAQVPDVRELLLTQPTGQCLVARRGQKAVAARILPPSSGGASNAQIEAVRAVARTNWSRPRAAIEEELRGRARWIAGLSRGVTTASPTPPATNSEPGNARVPQPGETVTPPTPQASPVAPPPSVEVRSGGRGRTAPQDGAKRPKEE